MKAKIERHDDLTIINLNGKLTTGGPDVLLRQKMGELLEQGTQRIVLNLKNVPWMDSGGIGELVACQKRAAQAGAEIRLINVHGRSYDQLQLVKLFDYFHIFRNKGDAIGSFR